jgi:hypothetical protein
MMNFEDWLEGDSVEMVAQMRAILADPYKSNDEKLEALTLLANLADEEALEVLRWYRLAPDAGLELYAELALAEAEYLASEPQTNDWEDEVVDLVLQVADGVHAAMGGNADRLAYQESLVRALQAEGVRVDEGARALVKYDGQLIELAALDMVLEGKLLVGIWGQDDESQRLDEAEEGEFYDPADRFYADLRASNLSWGLLLDMTGSVVTWELLQNMDKDRGVPTVEYILTLSSSRGPSVN